MNARELARLATDELVALNDFLTELFLTGRMNPRRQAEWDRVDIELSARA